MDNASQKVGNLDEEELERLGYFDDGIRERRISDAAGLNMNAQNFERAKNIDGVLRNRGFGAMNGAAGEKNETYRRKQGDEAETDSARMGYFGGNEKIRQEGDQTADLDIESFLPQGERDGARDAAGKFEITPTMPPERIYGSRQENAESTRENTEMVGEYVDARGNTIDPEVAKAALREERSGRKSGGGAETAKIGSTLNKQGVQDIDDAMTEFEKSGNAADFYAIIRGGKLSSGENVEGKVEEVLKASFDDRAGGIGEKNE